MEPDMTFDTGIKNLPFPIRVVSREHPEGQQTVAEISVSARVSRKQEGDWINPIIRILHAHRDRIGASTLRANIMDYLLQMDAEMVRVDFKYPFFYEKKTPVSNEKCLVRYPCTYSAKVPSITQAPWMTSRVEILILTSFPTPACPPPVQTSRLIIETESKKDIFPEDLVDMADRHALSPVYSFLTRADQDYLTRLFKTSHKSVEETLCGIHEDLCGNHDIAWHSIRCANRETLLTYETEMSADRKMLSPYAMNEMFEA